MIISNHTAANSLMFPDVFLGSDKSLYLPSPRGEMIPPQKCTQYHRKQGCGLSGADETQVLEVVVLLCPGQIVIPLLLLCAAFNFHQEPLRRRR
jgi:hypothetical protein